MIPALLLLIWLAAGLLLLLLYRRDLSALWREPVLKRPLLIIESDDWGVGPVSQAEALRQIAGTLERFQDREGRHPVATLAIVLATVEKGAEGCRSVDLRDQRFADLRDAVLEGCRKGVFDLQLHGKEHFWPPVLLQVAEQDPAVADWIGHAPEAATERLPPPLQSRWIDAAVLPSRPLAEKAINQAVREEVRLFEDCFGRKPAVAVPPTFIWNQVVEQAWKRGGVGIVVTPGRRFDSRDSKGRPVAAGGSIRNGALSDDGLRYVVRDDYFEPYLGHRAERVLAALEHKTRLARPTLLETHRLNFLDAETRRSALAELEGLLDQVVQRYPDIVFVSTEQLARAMERDDSAWMEYGLGIRLHVFIERLWILPRMRKLLWVTTWMVPVWLLWVSTGWLSGVNKKRGESY